MAEFTDEQIEAFVQKHGAKWDGNHWTIEDADLHPLIRAALSATQEAGKAEGECPGCGGLGRIRVLRCEQCDGTGKISAPTSKEAGKSEPDYKPRKFVRYGDCQCILTQYCDGTCNPIYEDPEPSKEAGKVEAVADERQPSDGDYLRWAEQAGAKVNWDFESASSARVVFLTASQWGRFCDKVRALYLHPSQPEPTSKGADGWKLVPIKPTEDMLFKMAEVDGHLRGDRDHPMLTRWEDYWNMALDASPAPPASQQRETQEAAEHAELIRRIDEWQKAQGPTGAMAHHLLIAQCRAALSAPQEASKPAPKQFYIKNIGGAFDEWEEIPASKEASKPKKCTCIYATAKNTAAVRSGHEMGGYIKERDPSCPEHGTASKEAGKVEAVADERYADDIACLRGAVSHWRKVLGVDNIEAARKRVHELARPVVLEAIFASLYLRPSQQALGDAKDAARYRYLRENYDVSLVRMVYGHNNATLQDCESLFDSAILAAAGGSEK